MKKCFKCNKIKLLDEFYRHSEMRDGHLNKCKDCCKEYTKKHRIFYKEICMTCGKEFSSIHPRQIFCSRYCFINSDKNKLKKGHPGYLTKDSINRSRIAVKERWKNPEYKKMVGNKISESSKGKKILPHQGFQKGENHWNWKGGSTPEHKKIRRSIEYRLWRESVFKKDDYICHKCNIRGGKLHPHHILNFADFPKLRMLTENGITLCVKCHKQFHKIYGKKYNTVKQIELYMVNDKILT